jgi:multiple antibiotic resistance protein
MSIYTVIITLILVMDPFGNIPVFLSILHVLPPARRRLVIVRELLIALAVLVLFLFTGQALLSGMNISRAALQVAGGIILFLIAVRMIFPAEAAGPGSFSGDQARATTTLDTPLPHHRNEPFIVPLAVPLIAGPSAMAYVILISTQYPDGRLWWLLALLAAWAFSAIVLLCADLIGRFLGDKVLTAIERLMGMILTTLAVQMLLEGLKNFLA